MKKIIPIVLTSIAFIYTLMHAFPPKEEEGYRINDFGRTPVLLNGRIQPIDTVARNALIQIAGKSKIPDSKTPAMDWFMEVITDTEKADSRNIFRMHHPEVIKDYNLEGKGYWKKGLFWFSINDLRPQMESLFMEAGRVAEIKREQRKHQEQQILEVANAVQMYQRLKLSFLPEGFEDLRNSITTFYTLLPEAIDGIRKQQAGQPIDKEKEERVNQFLFMGDSLEKAANASLPSIIPPEAGQPSEAWQPLAKVMMDSFQTFVQNPAAVDPSNPPLPKSLLAYAEIQSAFKAKDQDAFNSAVDSLQSIMLTTKRPHKAAESEYLFGKLISATAGKAVDHFQKPSRKGKIEFFFNHLNPFACAQGIYMLGFLAALVFVIRPKWTPAWGTAMGMTLLAFAVHSGGIMFRMFLEGRPPITNLYSSAVFVGWGAILLAIFGEAIFKNGLNILACSLIGFITLLVAHFLSLDGDTMANLQAVLDTNAWLATHVTTVTFGYSATFVAGFLGVLYMVMGILTPVLDKEKRKMMSKVIYGIICFATLFSFVGTILGGIWADQSWGRFWGWDPKENGALLIVIWNAMILHARWGGMIKERGLVNMAIFGNIVTAFSWFGTNLLGVGLHSYGFMEGTFWPLIYFCLSQLALTLIGMFLPTKFWLSYRKSDDKSSMKSDSSPAAA